MKELFREQKIILIQEIQKELMNQYNKFGYQTHTIESWFSILLEEIGEIAKAINKMHEFDNFDKWYLNYKTEIIQSITLLIQMYFKPYSINFEDKTITQ